ncbi:Phytochrome-like protein cph1 [Acaryochloris thomasi RCC1774]|uniref:histidine kinase n=1 Tax=Acaryochloris thomasi RCC1774 TaxID=1764569 RepID=A0A2W1JBB3_9CYAN|nr:ATP-binding protein [Acaryochloris thomasi]PZD71206.1 Phytochrome-like protein cph1 [Acaryochloris thomasi RCC1774]
MTSSSFVSQIKQQITTLTNPDIAPPDVSLTNCDREPIHIPSAIQPHGVLLTFTEADLTLLQVSRNVTTVIGLTPEQLWGQPLTHLFAAEQLEQIRGCLTADFEHVNPLRLSVEVDGQTRSFGGIVHRADTVVVLELEPLQASDEIDFFDFYRFVKTPISQLQRTQTVAELCHTAAAEIRRITGFDRVMIYRFDQAGAGDVIAEDRRADLKAFLGLHYPATDIPQQAKHLYRLNLLRLIPDAVYEPVPLEPQNNPVTDAPLDMSLSVLRSVSSVHREYLGNMGVRASMSISLLKNQQLWGLIACHHCSPKLLSYELRTICEFLGQSISLELATKSETEDLDDQVRLQSIQANFVKASAHCQTLADVLSHNPDNLMALGRASGLIFYEGDAIISFGQTPPEPVISKLLDWVEPQFEADAVLYTTASLGLRCPEMADYRQVASGLMALRISRVQKIYLLWLRPEVVQTVHWGGQQKQQEGVDADGLTYLSPRKSFERWQETVQMRSLPWKACEQEAALELRSTIIGVVLQKSDELALLNADLERSNSELDSFAYVASHDLKEPLRGIHNYSSFLIEDYGDQLGEEGQHKLETLVRLAQRMEDLISSLLHYSRLGRAELVLHRTDMGEVVTEVLDVIKISQPEPIEFRIPRPLPTLACDRIRISELFTNLISNAIKYNDKPHKWIEMGYVSTDEDRATLPSALQQAGTVFYVRDNGIGIRDRHLENVFKIFKRLHAPGRYGGGTGAGLTIVKKIVERHGGEIIIESAYGEGSTFYFSLGEVEHV